VAQFGSVCLNINQDDIYNKWDEWYRVNLRESAGWGILQMLDG